ncbi:MAG TPA: glycosyltransferase family 4 protein [Bryobacteraceae bacterium]|jgi:glycosyltransferase involved in cell wall biosynthesis
MAQRDPSNELRRVYLVSWWFADFGGMERHITELAKSLRTRGIEVTVFTEMPARRANQYRKELREAGIGFVSPRLPRGPVAWFQGRFPRKASAGAPADGDPVSRAMGASLMARLLKFILARRLKRENPDVVHVHGWRLSQWVVTWCASRGIPVIYTEHSTISDWGGPVDACAPDLLAGAGDVACVSDAARGSLAQWMPDRSLGLHHHIIRLPDAAAPHKPGGTLRLTTVARLRHEKGLDILLSAAAKLWFQGVVFRLEIIGDGPMHNELITMRNGLGLESFVDLPGSLRAAEVHQKLRQTDIFVLASRTEALSLALLEAMAHGLSIVATAVGGIPEFIRDDETGLLVQAESVDALAGAMRKLALDDDLRARLGRNARRELESGHFSEAACIARVLASYEKARNAAAR